MLRNKLPYVLPVILGILILPLPLVRDFHFESAMIAAISGSFWAGISFSKTTYKTGAEKLWPVVRSVYLFGLPPFLFSLFSGCLNVHGIGFWLLVPLPSIIFGAAFGRFFNHFIPRFSGIITFLVLLFISVGAWFIELFHLPQVFFFNHVWGIWPGPIYDESVRVTSSLVFFRTITLLWVVVIWALPSWNLSRLSKVTAISGLLFVSLFYLRLPDLGIITPRDYLKQELGYYHHTDHFELYFAGDNFTKEEIEYWALRHEFHFQQIIEVLEVDWPAERKIESYVYANAWQKKELVGAKFTSYVPIWLEQDQLHIAKQHLDAVLKHELVHVISKQFGNELFHGTWSIGLIEGLAEGIAKDASRESTLDQIMAANPPYPTTEQVRSSLSISGFYSSAGAISYTTTGSFVQFLLQNYSVEQFKKAYAHTDFDSAYEVPLDTLVETWIRSLPEVELDSVDKNVSELLFSQRSIFQKSCPHSVSRELELWDQVRYHQSNEDDSLAFKVLQEMLTLNPDNSFLRQEWMRYHLDFGNYGTVSRYELTQDSLPTLLILKADAYALQGAWEKGYDELTRAWEKLPYPFPPSFEHTFEIRVDTTNWTMLNAARYLELIPPSGSRNLSTSTEMVIMSEAIQQNKAASVTSYAHSLFDMEKDLRFFSLYLEMIDRLIYLHHYEIAQHWLDELSEMDLRPRYRERLQEQQEWLEYVRRVMS